MTDGTGLTNVDASTFHGTGAAETVFSLHNLRHLTPIFANCHLHFIFLGTIVKVNWGVLRVKPTTGLLAHVRMSVNLDGDLFKTR